MITRIIKATCKRALQRPVQLKMTWYSTYEVIEKTMKRPGRRRPWRVYVAHRMSQW
jgi:hypothetical protein